MASTHLLISHARLKQLVHYEPETGVFTAIQKRPHVPVGAKLGSKHHTGYLIIGIDRRYYQANRLAYFYMTGEWPVGEVDHINGIRDDDRWGNLRACSKPENGKNRSISSNNTSGRNGVFWHIRIKRWQANIRVDGKLLHLGYFDNFDDAVAARHAAELEHFGAFSPLVCRSS